MYLSIYQISAEYNIISSLSVVSKAKQSQVQLARSTQWGEFYQEGPTHARTRARTHTTKILVFIILLCSTKYSGCSRCTSEDCQECFPVTDLGLPQVLVKGSCKPKQTERERERERTLIYAIKGLSQNIDVGWGSEVAIVSSLVGHRFFRFGHSRLPNWLADRENDLIMTFLSMYSTCKICAN